MISDMPVRQYMIGNPTKLHVTNAVVNVAARLDAATDRRFRSHRKLRKVPLTPVEGTPRTKSGIGMVEAASMPGLSSAADCSQAKGIVAPRQAGCAMRPCGICIPPRHLQARMITPDG